MGVWAVLLMGVVCVACGSAALGLLRCKRWGYRTALVILTINLAGDTTNAVVAHDWRTLIGPAHRRLHDCISDKTEARV